MSHRSLARAKLASTVALGAMLLTPVAAEGHNHRSLRHGSGDPSRVSLARAGAFWGMLPCAGNVTVTTGDLSALYGFAPGYAAAVALAPCTIMIDRGTGLVSALSDSENFSQYCTLIAHEIGHLLGYHHVTDPTSIMYSGAGMPARFPTRQCAQPFTFWNGGWQTVSALQQTYSHLSTPAEQAALGVD